MNFVYYFHDVSCENDVEKILLDIRNKYNIISSDDMLKYLQGGSKINNSCVFTVDDGWISTYKYVLPVIKKYDVPITVFISPKIVKEESNFWYFLFEYCNKEEVKRILLKNNIIPEVAIKYPLKSILKSLTIDTIYNCLYEGIGEERLKTIPRGFINIEELKEMSRCPLVTIGAHTMTHPILLNEDAERSKYEICESIRELSDMLQLPVTTFAYPNGLFGLDFCDREMEYCKEAGIKMAFSTNPGYVKEGITNLMSIPRIGNTKRLKLGKLGLLIPSISKQNKDRKELKKLLL